MLAKIGVAPMSPILFSQPAAKKVMTPAIFKLHVAATTAEATGFVEYARALRALLAKELGR